MYRSLLSSLAKNQWTIFGIKRRAGVVAPLFSVYSEESAGIGELPDIKILVDWCNATGMSIIQLLPMNDVGFDFRPYDAQSTFALEPAYLRLDDIVGVDMKLFKKEITALKKRFPTGKGRVNYGIKAAKLEILWKMFKSIKSQTKDFEAYAGNNRFWLDDYVLFKVIKESCGQKCWEAWDGAFRVKDAATLQFFSEGNREALVFHKWVQWQLYLQFKAVKEYATKNGIFIMGDIPFLVSRDSADVWAHQDYFKLYLSSGAPPDMYFAHGQRWGMPPYNWDNIARHGYDYVKEKLRYAENFFDLYRIDHVVGMYRVWTIPLSEPVENAGLNGTFDPKDEHVWEAHGKKLLSIMVNATDMLPCAEDLGVVPTCSDKVLEDLGIPGIEVQRWARDWVKTYAFKDPEKYRKNSIATVATHDSTSLCMWWKFDAGTVDEKLFQRKCSEKHVSFDNIKHALFDVDRSGYGRLHWKPEIDNQDKLLKVLNIGLDQAKELVSRYKESFDERQRFWHFLGLKGHSNEECGKEFVKRALEMALATSSIFSIHLLQDWLALDDFSQSGDWEFRINFPGTMSDKNWSITMPVSLEEMLRLPINKTIGSMNKKADRI